MKLATEAALEEEKLLLDWILNTRSLLISLPDNKFRTWSSSIRKIVSSKTSTFDELDSTLGRLTHISVIIPHMKHFMSRIRQEKKRARNRRKIKLKEEAPEAFNLHLYFLKLANTGISMNLLTFHKLTHIYIADTRLFSLGGYSARGRAWRWYIPKNLQFRATINMLEHIASIIGPWIDLIESNLPVFSCILSMTDSTTAAGWLRKSNFQESI